MGLYDELEDIQVKCFSELSMTPKNMKDKLDIGFVGGCLRYFSVGDVVPYKTPYYCYGKDFIVFDFRCFKLLYSEEKNKNIEDYIVLSVIQDGKFVGNFSYIEYEQKFGDKEMPLVIDHYGRPSNVCTLGDFKEICCQWLYYQRLYSQLQDLKCINFGIPTKLLRVEDYNADTNNKIDYMDYLALHNRAVDEAFKESLNKFNDLWFKSKSERDKEINYGEFWGSIYTYLTGLYCIEFDKYVLCHAINIELKKREETFSESYNSYLDWCRKNDIHIDENEIIELYKNYNKDVPINVLEDYRQSKEYRDRVFMFGKEAKV